MVAYSVLQGWKHRHAETDMTLGLTQHLFLFMSHGAQISACLSNIEVFHG